MGRYVAGLLSGMGELVDGPELLLTLFSLRGQLPPTPGHQFSEAPRRLPARLLRRTWAHSALPPAEVLTGRIDVFHGTNFMTPPTARAASVVTVHDLAFLHHADTVTGDAVHYRTLVPRALSRGAHVITVSRAVAEEVRDTYRLPAERVSVAHHGVDPAWAAAALPDAGTRERLGLPPRYVLFAGNQEPRKNLGLLVRAHRDARQSLEGVPPLVLVGPAGWGDRWQGTPPDPADVVVLGYLSDDDLPSVVRGASALCMPSTYEGFGLPVVEALAAGVPVLASDIAAHREVGGDQVQLVDPRDASAWSRALGELDQAPGTPATRRAWASRYTWRESALAHLRAWERAVEAR
ncbi:hypothetical protein ASG41_01785 [Modestobacter sp. Leaf380]|nr:hypothetical protein ASG41_01785 [Modestobacter sp. Leaf380]